MHQTLNNDRSMPASFLPRISHVLPGHCLKIYILWNIDRKQLVPITNRIVGRYKGAPGKGIHSVISFQSCYFVPAVSRMGGENKGCNSQKIKLKVMGFKLEWTRPSRQARLCYGLSRTCRTLAGAVHAVSGPVLHQHQWRLGLSEAAREVQEAQEVPGDLPVQPKLPADWHQLPSIIQCIAKMEEQKEAMDKMADKRLSGKIIYVALTMYHGCNRLIIKCQAVILPQYILRFFWLPPYQDLESQEEQVWIPNREAITRKNLLLFGKSSNGLTPPPCIFVILQGTFF